MTTPNEPQNPTVKLSRQPPRRGRHDFDARNGTTGEIVECAELGPLFDVIAGWFGQTLDGKPELYGAAPELVTALEAVATHLHIFMEGESCDHSVGICYCNVNNALGEAADALARVRGEERTNG